MMIRVPLLPEKRVYEYINPGLLCVRVHAEKRDARYSLMTIALPTCKISPTRPLCSRFFCQKEAFSREKKEREDTQHKHENREAKKLCSPGPPPFFFFFSRVHQKARESRQNLKVCVVVSRFLWRLLWSFFLCEEEEDEEDKEEGRRGRHNAFRLVILFDSDCARAHLATSRRNVFLERERERDLGKFQSESRNSLISDRISIRAQIRTLSVKRGPNDESK